MGRILSPAEVLERVPQQPPFRFVDELVEIDGEHAIGTYRWDPASDVYRGHFPGNPVTPGVLLIESMAQCGVVPMAIYRFFEEFEEDEAAKFQTLFTDASVDFSGIVRPGELVRTETSLVFYRRRKLKVEARMLLEDGSVVCSGQLAGMGVLG